MRRGEYTRKSARDAVPAPTQLRTKTETRILRAFSAPFAVSLLRRWLCEILPLPRHSAHADNPSRYSATLRGNPEDLQPRHDAPRTYLRTRRSRYSYAVHSVVPR